LLDNTQSSDDVIINSVVSALCNTLNDAAKNTCNCQQFDSVWRSALWSKLNSYNVSGKHFNVIKKHVQWH